MSNLLDKYRSTEIRHPSWRIYKAIQDIKADEEIDLDTRNSISPQDFGLKGDTSIYIPYVVNDDPTNQLIMALLSDSCDDEFYNISSCMTLFLDVKARQPIECMLMSGRLPPDIAADIGVPSSLIETYAFIFFDISVWRTDADKIAYLSKGLTDEDKRIKSLVISKGLDYVLIHEYNLPARIKMDNALVNMFGKMYEQTMQMINSPDIEEQKLAQTWSKRVLEVFSELKNATKDEGGIRELTIALQTSPAPKRSLEDL